MGNEKLRKVTDIGDPNLNIEWASLEKPLAGGLLEPLHAKNSVRPEIVPSGLIWALSR